MLLLCQVIFAQQDTIVKLKEVVVSDVQLQRFSNSLSVEKLNDSIIENNRASLTSLLQYNTVIYFKENGLGMVSSPSFRGTTAQQTAVIWNGININSQLNGLTDFNTITTNDFENITVRAGGGSAIYGSSAIGGSIHLNNELQFKNQFRNRLLLNYGSFNTFGANYKTSISDKKVSTTISISRNSSDNDYDYLGTKDKKNENGQFFNTSMNVSFGYRYNTIHEFHFYSQFFDGERHFSLVNATDTKTKYKDFNIRNLIEWKAQFHQFESNLKFAFLSEEYKYYESINKDSFTFGKVETLLAKYNFSYNWEDKLKITVLLDATQNKGNGSDIAAVKRQIGAAGLLLSHAVSNQFYYECTIRKEATSSYNSPILYTIGANYKPFSFYALKANISRNYRIPTFNDLYWVGLGNPELKAERSYQTEISNEFSGRHYKVTATVYHTDIKDLIRWLPGTGGLFSPSNTAKVEVNGLEILLHLDKKIGRNRFDFNGTYAYTDSENKDTGNQLIYVPFHKATAALGYNFRPFSLGYQYLFTGAVFKQSDNNPNEIVDWYSVSNCNADIDLGRKDTCKIGFKVLNLWNRKYQSVEGRPMPGRNFNVYLILNF